MKERHIKVLLLLFVIMILLMSFISCKDKEEDLNKQEITISFDSNGGSEINSVKKYSGEEIGDLQVPTLEGYTFIGWYYNNVSVNKFTVFKEDAHLVAKWTENNIVIQTVLDNEVTQSNSFYKKVGDSIEFSAEDIPGYEFLGWYIQDTKINSEKSFIYTVVYSTKKVYFAKYKIIPYLIKFIGDNGNLISEEEYVYGQEIVYPKESPIKNYTESKVYLFKGWSEHPQIATQDIEIVAIFDEYDYKETDVFYYVDDVLIKNVKCIVGTKMEPPKLYGSEVGLTGFGVDTWYSASDCIDEYFFDVVGLNNIILYGKWNSYITGNGFNKYEKFLTCGERSNPVVLKSREEFASLIEYVAFYDIENLTYVKLDYEYTSKSEEFSLAKNMNTYSNISVVDYESSFANIKDYAIGAYKNTDSDSIKGVYDKSQINTIKSDKSNVYQDVKYILEDLYVIETRSEDYDNFNVNKRPRQMDVESSDQLFYALQYGYKPICKASSSAESIYNKAKTVLREICSDSMSDMEKVRAIYNWMVENVYYDHYIVKQTSITNSYENWTKYQSWYAEGVFDNNVAVCDAYAKAFVIMANIEGIPCVRIVAEKEGAGHAWNKVYIDEKWYNIDSTFANIGLTVGNKNYEAMDETNFLLSDEQKYNYYGYTQLNFKEIIADKEYDIFVDRKFDYLGEKIDLYSISDDDTKNALKYINNKVKTRIDDGDFVLGDYISFEMKFVFGTTDTAVVEYAQSINNATYIACSKIKSLNNEVIYLFLYQV